MPEYVEYLIISIAALSLIAIGLAAFFDYQGPIYHPILQQS